MILKPNHRGIEMGLIIQEGSKEEKLNLPLSKIEIEQYYKLPGFLNYVSWEELYETGLLKNGYLTYENYYELLNSEEGTDLVESLNLPVSELELTGELRLDSLPNDGNLSLQLYMKDGRNLSRVGKEYGALFEIEGNYQLLPKKVYELKKALYIQYESGYQKIGVCQKAAIDANISLENFLQEEQYRVLDQYELDIKIHSPDHIELIPSGATEQETYALNQVSSVTSFKEGTKRERYVRNGKITEDVKKISEKRHITGEEVPIFIDNPSAVLPEHDYQFDLELFSDRVKGLIPIERVRPVFTEGSGMGWFDYETNQHIPYDEQFLKGLMEQNPNKQYAQHDGKWIYLDPILRKTLLEAVDDEEENKLKQKYELDIAKNEEELEYKVDPKELLGTRSYPIPKGLRAELFDHQLEGYRWICHLANQRRGGLLADDMGLGKTIQVITYLLYQNELGLLKPTLIVLPIALIENWIKEIEKFAPELMKSIYVHRGSTRLKSSKMIAQYDLVFTSYDTLKIDQIILGKVAFQSIICDETQNAKSHTSQRSRALRAMQSEFRLAMTGTPVENSLDELWSIMDFVQPGYLESLREFRAKYVETNEYNQLLQTLQPYYLRRTKEEVMKDRLPEKHVRPPITVEASPVQKSIAESMLQTKETGQIAILNMLMRLRQLYGHPGVVIPDYETLAVNQIPKLNEVIKILDEVRAKGEKAIIFTEFRKIHSILKRIFMQHYGISIPIIDGDTKNRQAVVQHFNESSGFGVMLLSPKAAGVGLTITSANHVIHYTRWWNPAVENQATDRAYRIGQQKDVFVYHIITKDSENFPQGTVEELMHDLLESKKELAENVIVPFNAKEVQQELWNNLVKDDNIKS